MGYVVENEDVIEDIEVSSGRRKKSIDRTKSALELIDSDEQRKVKYREPRSKGYKKWG